MRKQNSRENFRIYSRQGGGGGGGESEAQANMEETYRQRLPFQWLRQLTLKKGAPGNNVRSAMPAASQLPERGPTDVDDNPVPACNYSKI